MIPLAEIMLSTYNGADRDAQEIARLMIERDDAIKRIRHVEALHRSIIDQGSKVLNATSDKGLSHTDFIEWALERLEGK